MLAYSVITYEAILFLFVLLYIAEIMVLTLLYGIFPKFQNGKRYIILTMFLLTSPFLPMLPAMIIHYNHPPWNWVEYSCTVSFFATGGYLYGKFYNQMILPRYKQKKLKAKN